MLHLGFYLAALNNVVAPGQDSDVEHRFTATDLLIVASVAFGIAVILIIWMVFIRKKPKEEDYPLPGRSGDSKSPAGSGNKNKHRRRRHHRRDHRPRNPTLYQTGGLPAERPEDEPPRY